MTKRIKYIWKTLRLRMDSWAINLVKPRKLSEKEESCHRKLFGHEYMTINISEKTLAELEKTKQKFKRELDDREYKIWGNS